MQINVEPLYDASINIPHWIGETIPVDYKTAEEVGNLRNQAVRKIVKLSTSVIDDAFSSLNIIPDSKTVVVESSILKNTIVIHSTFGSRVNNTLASLLSAILSSQSGYVVDKTPLIFLHKLC